MSQSTRQHRQLAQGRTARCAVLTISDTRTKETDKGGRLIIESLEAAGHTIIDYDLVADEADQIDPRLRAWLTPPPETPSPPKGDTAEQSSCSQPGYPALDVIITTGGTGIARRDTTIEVVERLLDKKLEGFGELFRMLSWREVGAAAMLSRSVAGLAGETLLFALPGSTNAVTLAMTQLITPELPHLIWERKR